MKKVRKNSLDNTLRYLYATLRNGGASLVAIEFKHRGRQWRADTIEEALELRKLLDEEDQAAAMSGEEPADQEVHSWTPDVVTELLQGLGDLQKSFLRALYEHRTHVPSTDIVVALGLDAEVSLAGVLSGLSKQAKKLDIMPWNLYDLQITWKGKAKTRSFKLKGAFRWALDELGWPENWI